MRESTCPACGANIGPDATECKYCGEKIVRLSRPASMPVQDHSEGGSNIPQNVPNQNYQAPSTAIDPSWPVKSRTTAGVLAILLGGLGIHKFYLGNVGMGILYFVFCWTWIPSVIGIIEGIIYLTSSDESFQLKNHVRIG